MTGSCHRRKPKRSGFKATPEQRQELIDLYIEKGQKAVLARQIELGLGPKYTANLCSIMGIHRRDEWTSAKRGTDPRWAWAKQRGAVVA